MFKVWPLTEKSAEACMKLGTKPLFLSHTRQSGSGNAPGEICTVCSLGVRFTRSLNRRNEFDSLTVVRDGAQLLLLILIRLQAPEVGGLFTIC